MRFLPNGPGVLVEFDSLQETLAFVQNLHAEPIVGVHEIIPAARTVYVRHVGLSMAGFASACRERKLAHMAQPSASVGQLHEISVQYDGADLHDLAQRVGLTPEAVVAAHSSPEYFVAFVGFAPGFAYLAGGDPLLQVSRRATPRTAIPAGSVAIAGEFSAVYPASSPGGWQLLGRTDAVLWSLDRAQPALLQPGDRVRFVPVRGRSLAVVPAEHIADGAPAPARPETTAAPCPGSPGFEVVRPGGFTTLQDAGRPLGSQQGVSPSGALDVGAFHAANALAGNECDAPALEVTGGGLVLRARQTCLVAVTGAATSCLIRQTARTTTSTESGASGAGADAATGAGAGVRVPSYRALRLDPGDEIEIEHPAQGWRSYVAVHGGFEAHRVLGSVSFDALASLGAPPLAQGQVLHIGDNQSGMFSCANAGPHAGLDAGLRAGSLSSAVATGATQDSAVFGTQPLVLQVHPGPRDSWFTAAARDAFVNQTYTVTPQSNRIGARLAGSTPLGRAVTHELASEATVTGAIQVPPDGQPIVFLNDHPVTGGYPVIGTVAPAHLGLMAQARPGQKITFQWAQESETNFSGNDSMPRPTSPPYETSPVEPFKRSDSTKTGTNTGSTSQPHTITVALFALEPALAHAPSYGRITHLRFAGGPGITVQSHCATGEVISPDSTVSPSGGPRLLAQYQITAPDEITLWRRVGRAVAETRIEGLATNCAALTAVASANLERALSGGNPVQVNAQHYARVAAATEFELGPRPQYFELTTHEFTVNGTTVRVRTAADSDGALPLIAAIMAAHESAPQPNEQPSQ